MCGARQMLIMAHVSLSFYVAGRMAMHLLAEKDAGKGASV